MDIHEAKKLIDDKKIVVVDIRDDESYNAAHIPGAILLNDQTVAEFLTQTDKNQLVLCCCYHGITSQGAAEYFRKNGFVNVHSLDGGIENWRLVYETSSS